MINHKKLSKWLPPGGHVDDNEIPDQAAIRECKEETGLDVTLLGERGDFDGALVRPIGSQLNVIDDDHEHIDLVYLAEPNESGQALSLNTDECSEVRWFGLDEILKDDFNTFASIQYWCKKISRNLSHD